MRRPLMVRTVAILLSGGVESFAVDILGVLRQMQPERVGQIAVVRVGHGYSNASSFFQGWLPISGSVWKDSR
jgi:hypothetical protein